MADISALLWQAQLKAGFARKAINASSDILKNYLNPENVRFVNLEDRVVLKAENMTPEYPLQIGSALFHLRSALDTAIYQIWHDATQTESENIYFPIARNEQKFIESFEPKQRNNWIREKLPKLEAVLVSHIKPWPEGNEMLFNLAKMDNINKHRMIIPILANVAWEGSQYCVSNANGPRAWYYETTFRLYPGGQVVIAGPGETVEITIPGTFHASAVFDTDLPFAGQEVFTVLREMSDTVTDTINILDQHFSG